MKDIQKFNTLKPYVVTVNSDLDKYDDMPLFQEKKDKVAAILEKYPVPAHLLKEMQDRRIKRRFEQNMPIEQIAQVLDLPKTVVLFALEEMGLIKSVIA